MERREQAVLGGPHCTALYASASAQITTAPCRYNGVEKFVRQNPDANSEVLDIEDLARVGESRAVCPYFLARCVCVWGVRWGWVGGAEDWVEHSFRSPVGWLPACLPRSPSAHRLPPMPTPRTSTALFTWHSLLAAELQVDGGHRRDCVPALQLFAGRQDPGGPQHPVERRGADLR